MRLLSAAFDDLIAEAIALEAACFHGRARTAVRALRDTALHKVITTINTLEQRRIVEEDEYERTRDAYRAVLSLGMLLDEHVRPGRDCPGPAHASAQAAVGGMLDALRPYVQQRDDAMRRILLEHIPIDTAMARLQLAD
jgi:hypothetical protein